MGWLARIALTVLLGGHVTAIAQSAPEFPLFGQVDYWWTQNPQRFQSLWQMARTQTVRIAVLGDSQETNPGGAGRDYIPQLSYEMWKRFGNVPETPVEGCSSYGGGEPWADWLLRGGCTTPGPSPTRLAPTQILPGPAMQPKAYSTLNGASNVNGEYFGQLTMLQQDANGIDPEAGIPSTNNYFNPSGVIKARIFAATNASSGEIAYWAQPIDTTAPSFYAPVTTSGTLTLGLEAAQFAVKSGDTQPLDFGGNHYLALQVAGTDDTKLTDILGLRFFNETYPQGVVIDTLSQGGYEATSFLTNNGNAGALFQALGFHAAIIHYGANDSANGVSAQAFQSNIKAVIDLVRSWAADPTFPVILIPDVYYSNLTAANESEFDKYVGAALALAQADSNVMIINSRRLMDNIGWNGTSGQAASFMIDGVHYTPLGAQVLAEAEVAALMGELLVSTCATDPNGVVLPSTATLTVELGGAAPCTGFGQYTVANTLTLNQSTLNVVLTGGFTPTSGQSFKILAWDTLVGTFGIVNLPALPAGLVWDTETLYTNGTITARTLSAPTINTTSGNNQSFPAGTSSAPIGFAVTGFGPLTVSAVSNNQALLPNSGISISCGSTNLPCSVGFTVTSGETGTTTVTLTVQDTYGQSGSTTATINVQKPAPPTVSIISGSVQVFALGNSAAPIAFKLAGTGALNVTAVSSNTALLPNSGISFNSGCGSSMLSCTANPSVEPGQTGSTTLSLTAADVYGQMTTATTTIQVSAASSSTTGTGSGTGGSGAVDMLSLLLLGALSIARQRTPAPGNRDELHETAMSVV